MEENIGGSALHLYLTVIPGTYFFLLTLQYVQNMFLCFCMVCLPSESVHLLTEKPKGKGKANERESKESKEGKAQGEKA